jgi:hypothetical protein
LWAGNKTLPACIGQTGGQEKKMKKGIMFLALALLVAGGVFAQRVGDTIQVYGQSYRVQETSGGRLVLQLISLDGSWQYGGKWIVNFNGSTGVITGLGSGHDTKARDAINKGIIKVGDYWFRNLTKTGDMTWSGQGILFNDTNRNVASGVDFFNCTITLSADNQTFRVNFGSGNITYTRRQ